jgi:hypothetical protein
MIRLETDPEIQMSGNYGHFSLTDIAEELSPTPNLRKETGPNAQNAAFVITWGCGQSPEIQQP